MLDPSVTPCDVDVWLEGPAALTRAAQVAVVELEREFGLPFDVAVASELPPSIRRACQWNAAQGLAVVGRAPRCPDSLEDGFAALHQTAYQMRAACEARALIAQAEVLLLVGVPEGPASVEVAARLYLRSFSTTPAEWRRVRRLSPSAVIHELSSFGCAAPIDSRAAPSHDPIFVSALRAVIESRVSDPNSDICPERTSNPTGRATSIGTGGARDPSRPP
jgi:hypothetical protein